MQQCLLYLRVDLCKGKEGAVDASDLGWLKGLPFQIRTRLR
jgi:hypothetical protein